MHEVNFPAPQYSQFSFMFAASLFLFAFIFSFFLFLFISDIKDYNIPVIRLLPVDQNTGSTIIPLIPHVQGTWLWS